MLCKVNLTSPTRVVLGEMNCRFEKQKYAVEIRNFLGHIIISDADWDFKIKTKSQKKPPKKQNCILNVFFFSVFVNCDVWVCKCRCELMHMLNLQIVFNTIYMNVW